MNTRQIESILEKDKFSKKIFIATLPRDIFLSKEIQYPSAYVCNLDDSSKGGSHWVALYFTNDKCEYFDSYGLPPLFNDMMSKISNNSKEILWNQQTIQSDKTTVCGQYCIMYILLRCRNYSLYEIVNIFSPHNLELNDHIVNEFIMLHFKTLVHNLPTHDQSFLVSQNAIKKCELYNDL